MTDAAFQLSEQATFCKPNDEFRPSQVGLPDFTTSQVCPETLSESVEPVDAAYPDGWYVRIMFDELLDPTIEELTEIIDATTGEGTGTFTGSIRGVNPVTLECESVTSGDFVAVDYDGYYSPSGNRVTWPVGPSLVIKPNDPTLIATGSECRITLNESITDKQGRTVPAAQRGPYTFSVAEITPIATDPTDSGDVEEPTEVDALYLSDSNFYWQFNTEVRVTSFCADTDFGGTFANLFADADGGFGSCDEGTEAFQLTPPVLASEAGGGWGVCNVTGDPCSTEADCTDVADTRCDTSYAYTYSGVAADDEIGIGYNTPLKTDTVYTFTLKEGTKLTDRCGRETTTEAPTADNLFSIQFKTNPFDLVDSNIVTGDVTPMVRKPTLTFTNVMDAATLEPSEFTLTPAPDGFDPAALGQFTGGEIIFPGNYAPATMYTLTINAGATVSDYYGATHTFMEAETITWTTQPEVTMTATSPANNGTIQKLATQELNGVSLTFNANMDVSTLTTDDFTFVNESTGQSVTTQSPFLIGVGSGGASANCSPTSRSCSLRIRADLAPGTYTFTLKQGAQISDLLGNVYTQESDLEINFTVRPVEAPVQCL